MRILLGGFGTRGDVQPIVALALGLRARGHDATVLAPPDFEAWVRGLGLAFVPAGETMQSLLRRLSDHGHLSPRAAFREVPRMLRSHFQVMEPLVPEVDVVVASSLTVAGASLAERFGKRYHYLGLCPQLIPSAAHPSPFLKAQTLPRWVNRLSWWLALQGDAYLTKPLVNEERRRLGLPPVRDSYDQVILQRLIMASEPTLAPLPDDGPRPGIALTGAFFLPEDEPLPDEVEAFLVAGPPPVYVGFGSMIDDAPEATTALILEAVRRAGVRALLSSGWAGMGGPKLPADVLGVGAVPHGRLFPRCAAVVHHGGAGTVATAARAGVPQLLVPQVTDQFFWAHRVHRLGLSPPPIARSALEVERLARSLRLCATDEALRQRAQAFAPGMIRDGVARAVRLIEGESAPAASAA